MDVVHRTEARGLPAPEQRATHRPCPTSTSSTTRRSIWSPRARPRRRSTRYREAIALDADFADGWQGLALALNDLGRHAEAIDAAKRLCELTPDDVLAHTTLSRMYQAANMIPEAEAAGAKARVLDWKRQLKEGQ